MSTRLCFWFLLAAAVPAGAQDLHFSQPYLFALQCSPAQTGLYEGDFRAAAIYRSQWSSVPVPYRTMGLSADKNWWHRGANGIGAGIQVAHDKAGDAGLSWTQLGITGSVHRSFSAQQTLSAGFGLALVQRQVDISGLRFKNQWTGDVFDPALPSKESFNQSSGLAPSLSAGLAWRLAVSRSRTQAEVAVGAFHLNRPELGLGDAAAASRLPLRWSLQANCVVEANESADLVVFALVQQMRTARELVFGAGGRLWLTPGQSALRATLGIRFGDALLPAVQYEAGDWTVGLSYDWNISGFKAATAGRGGFEIGAVYRSLTAPSVKTFKSCPVF